MPPSSDTTDLSWASQFRQMGAIWESRGPHGPHVETSLGGAHVDKYFNSDVVLSSPTLTAQVIESVLVPALGEAPDWVIGYAPFGIFVAHAAAQALGARCAYGDPASGYATYFDISPSDSVLVVADDVYSGGSILRTVEQVERRGAQPVPIVFCLANLSGKRQLANHEIVAAAEFEAHRYKAGECPLCAKGSVALAPRPNWPLLVESMPDLGDAQKTG